MAVGGGLSSKFLKSCKMNYSSSDVQHANNFCGFGTKMLAFHLANEAE
jgi:hypothetical protein